MGDGTTREKFQARAMIILVLAIIIIGNSWLLFPIFPYFADRLSLFYLSAVPLVIGIFLGSLLQWRFIKKLPRYLRFEWVMISIVGPVLAMLIAIRIIDPELFVHWEQPGYLETVAGWDSYYSLVFGLAGIGLGLAQWSMLRREIRRLFWVPVISGLGGFATGLILGSAINNTFDTYGWTSNGYGERLMGGMMIGCVPTMLSLIGIALLISIGAKFQASLQKKTNDRERPPALS